MAYIIEPERKIPVIGDFELLVCGGGVAGVAAAISAARVGAKVMLIEKYGFLGGLCTGSLVLTVPPLDNGINIELAERLKKRGAYVPCLNSGPEVAHLYMYGIDPEIAKYEFIKWLQEEDVKILLHSYITDLVLEGNLIKGVIIQSKLGRQAILTRLVIDATGDADIAALAGAPFRETKKPMTMMFNMVGVNVNKVMENFGNWSGIKKMVKEGIEKGELDFALGILPEFGSPGVYAEDLPGEGQINVWSGNLLGLNGLDPQDLTKAEIVTREHVHRLANFLRRKVPGFEKSRIELTSTQVGVRATRNIIGGASPTLEEATSKKFSDTVVKAFNKPNWPLSELRLPYGCLVPQKVVNLLVAGRCISAEEQAMGLLRLIPICLLTGQAAGVAAALSLKQEVTPGKLDVSWLQKNLEKQGMNLGLFR